jgi:hypothetical protein
VCKLGGHEHLDLELPSPQVFHLEKGAAIADLI